MNLKSTTANGLNFRIINSLMEFWAVRLTWFDCNGLTQVLDSVGHKAKRKADNTVNNYFMRQRAYVEILIDR